MIVVVAYTIYVFMSLQESVKALLEMRRGAKEKELEALLAGEHDFCTCFIEVISCSNCYVIMGLIFIHFSTRIL